MTDSTARAERIKPQSSAAPGYLWEVAQKPISVLLPYGMIDRLEKEVVENFRSLTSRGSEIGGLLLGTVSQSSPAVVTVDDFEVIPCDYSRGPLYRLSDADMGRFEYAVQQRMNSNGLSVVGYFRSHTRKGLSLDAEDIAFLDARFREAHQVALLVRPYATKASTAGIFIREAGVVQGEASYLEFPFRSSQLSSFRPSPLLAETPPPPPPTAAASSAAPAPAPAAPKSAARAQIVPIASRREINLPSPPPVAEPANKDVPAAVAPSAPETATPVVQASQPAVAVTPAPTDEPAAAVKEKEAEKPAAAEVKAAVKAEPAKTEEKKPEAKAEVKPAEVKKPDPAPAEVIAPAPETGKSGMAVWIVAAIGLILISLFVYPGFLKHGSVPNSGDAAIALRVEKTGSDILLTWNRDSDSIRNASHAVLYIFDGNRHENYDMDLGQLRNGSIVYSPITADVSFRMDVTRNGKTAPVSESVRVLRTRPSPMGDDAQTQAAQPAKPAGAPGAVAPGPTNAALPPAAAKPATPASDPGDPVITDEGKSSAPVSPTKPFDASSLVQRLRPATSSDLLEAPSINPGVGGGQPASNSISALNLNSVSAGPAAPPPPTTEKKGASPTGGQIKLAELISRKEPEYPKLARQMCVKGIVELTATIGVDGKVKTVKVEKGHPLLTKAASDAVMQWVYRPTLLNGQPVQNDTRITLNFLGDH